MLCVSFWVVSVVSGGPHRPGLCPRKDELTLSTLSPEDGVETLLSIPGCISKLQWSFVSPPSSSCPHLHWHPSLHCSALFSRVSAPVTLPIMPSEFAPKLHTCPFSFLNWTLYISIVARLIHHIIKTVLHFFLSQQQLEGKFYLFLNILYLGASLVAQTVGYLACPRHS